MKTKLYLLVIAAVLLGLALSACTRSASGPTTGVITATNELPFEFDTNGNLTEIVVATQNAVTAETPGAKAPTDPWGAGGQATDELPTALPLLTETPSVVIIEPTQAPLPPAVEWQPTAGIPTTYTVNKGEFAYCLARRFNVNPSDLLSANGLGVNTQLSPGTTLNIPQGSSGWPGERALMAHPTTYSVQAGDTVYSIACKFGDVDPNAIIAVNGLQAPYDLTPGQAINIP